MSEQRKKRKGEQNSHNDPINFTCGICKKVHPFDPDNPYKCPDHVYPPEQEVE